MTLSELMDILAEIKYKDWLVAPISNEKGLFIHVLFQSKCTVTGRKELQKGRKWYISPYSCKSEVVNTAFLAILTAEEHETRERFKYRGAPIYGPHFNIEKLVKLYCEGNSLETRGNSGR